MKLLAEVDKPRSLINNYVTQLICYPIDVRYWHHYSVHIVPCWPGTSVSYIPKFYNLRALITITSPYALVFNLDKDLLQNSNFTRYLLQFIPLSLCFLLLLFISHSTIVLYIIRASSPLREGGAMWMWMWELCFWSFLIFTLSDLSNNRFQKTRKIWGPQTGWSMFTISQKRRHRTRWYIIK